MLGAVAPARSTLPIVHPYRPRSVRYALANLAVAMSLTFGIALVIFSGVIGSNPRTTAAFGAALAVGVPIAVWRPSRSRTAIALAAAVAAAALAAILAG